jgi:serine/threonine protein kinase
MGEVYRGKDTRLGRPVAIKISARDFSDRFEREARAISALNHPNICTLYDVGRRNSLRIRSLLLFPRMSKQNVSKTTLDCCCVGHITFATGRN